MVLTKKEIVETVCTELGLSKKESITLVESIFKIIKDELSNGNDIMISRFGKWTVKVKRERKGRNPQTGRSIIIDARKVVTFKPSAVLRDTLNPGG
jgi:integration host factor subunit alpha